MKKILIAFTIVLFFSLVGCSNVKQEDDTKSNDPIQGDWIQEGKVTDLFYMIAHIDNDTIKIYSVANDGNVWALYWDGSYTAPETPSEKYTWTSKNNLVATDKSTSFCPRASHDETKEFTYENGELRYSGKSQDKDFTVILKHSDKTVAECNESAIAVNTNTAIDVGGTKITPSKIYGEFVENDADAKYYYYYSPHARLMIYTTSANDATEEAFQNEAYMKSFSEGILESINKDGNSIELINVESIPVGGHKGLLVTCEGMFDGCNVRLLLATVISPATNLCVNVTVTVDKNATYDYRADLLSMMEGVQIPEATNWSISYYVDEFGDPTTNPYVVGEFEGDFSNFLTNNERLTSLLYLDKKSPGLVSIRLFEYGRSRASISDRSTITIRVKTDAGEVKEFTGEAYSDDVDCYNASLVDLILTNKNLSWVITVSMTYSDTPDTYRFKTTNEGLMALYNMTE